MERAVFDRLAPAFARSGLVFLQGWGEPLLHPQFFDLLAAARARARWVGTTSNGMLIDAGMAESLVRAGLDWLGLSLAGGEKTNDRFRQGTSLGQVLRAVEQVEAAKRRLGRDRPYVNIAYLLLRSGREELDGLPALLRGRGINQVVVSTLDYLPAPDWQAETWDWQKEEDRKDLTACLAGLAARGRQAGLDIQYRVFDPRGRECPEQIQTSLFVSAAGAVSSCVFTNIPIAVAPGQLPCRPKTFGNVMETTLDALWRSADYSQFRRSFADGNPPDYCRNCRRLGLTTMQEKPSAAARAEGLSDFSELW